MAISHDAICNIRFFCATVLNLFRVLKFGTQIALIVLTVDAAPLVFFWSDAGIRIIPILTGEGEGFSTSLTSNLLNFP